MFEDKQSVLFGKCLLVFIEHPKKTKQNKIIALLLEPFHVPHICELSEQKKTEEKLSTSESWKKNDLQQRILWFHLMRYRINWKTFTINGAHFVMHCCTRMGDWTKQNSSSSVCNRWYKNCLQTDVTQICVCVCLSTIAGCDTISCWIVSIFNGHHWHRRSILLHFLLALLSVFCESC